MDRMKARVKLEGALLFFVASVLTYLDGFVRAYVGLQAKSILAL